MVKKTKTWIWVSLIVIVALIGISVYLFSNYYFPKCSEKIAIKECIKTNEGLYGFGIMDDGSIVFNCETNHFVNSTQRTAENKECMIYKFLWIRRPI